MGLDIYEEFTFPTETPTFSEPEVVNKFDAFCKPRISLFAARYQFLTMQTGRPVDEYLSALNKKSENAQLVIVRWHGAARINHWSRPGQTEEEVV